MTPQVRPPQPSPPTNGVAGLAARRQTRQRAAVRKVLNEFEGFRTASDIYTALRAPGDRIGRATVYRILQVFADQGEVDIVRSPSGESMFRLCGRGHHHHLMCRRCGRVVEVVGLEIESWAEKVASEHGYINVAHSVEIFGNCAECTVIESGPGADPTPSAIT